MPPYPPRRGRGGNEPFRGVIHRHPGRIWWRRSFSRPQGRQLPTSPRSWPPSSRATRGRRHIPSAPPRRAPLTEADDIFSPRHVSKIAGRHLPVPWPPSTRAAPHRGRRRHLHHQREQLPAKVTTDISLPATDKEEEEESGSWAPDPWCPFAADRSGHRPSHSADDEREGIDDNGMVY